MTQQTKRSLVLVGAVLVIALSVIFIFHQATAPKESIRDFSKIPPKGAGRFDRN